MVAITGNLKEGFALLKKTSPFIFLNLTVYGIFAGVTLLYFLLVGGLCYLIHSIAAIIFLSGLGLYGVLVYYAREYILYLIKAAHIAVLTELVLTGHLPEGCSQVAYGKALVKARVKDVSILFGIDQLVKAILKSLNRLVLSITSWLPLPGLDKLAQFIMVIINLSVSYVDEAILSYSLSKKEENPWISAKEGIVLYAQSYKEILKNALVIGVLGLISFSVIALILMLPGMGLQSMFPGIRTAVGFSVIIIAYLVKLALFNPLALCTMILTYHRAIQGQTPNPEWEAKLESVSSKFRKLKDKAAEWGKSKAIPA